MAWSSWSSTAISCGPAQSSLAQRKRIRSGSWTTSSSVTGTNPAVVARPRASSVSDSSEPRRCGRTNGQRSRQPSFASTYPVAAISPATVTVSGRVSRSSRVTRERIQDQRRKGGSASAPFHGNGDSRSSSPVSRSTPMTAVPSTGKSFAAAAVAWRSGGGDAARVYVAILAIERVLGLPALLRFCAVVQQEFSCGPLVYVLGLWPLLLGLALSVPVRRRLRIVAGDRNPLLEAGGA